MPGGRLYCDGSWTCERDECDVILCNSVLWRRFACIQLLAESRDPYIFHSLALYVDSDTSIMYLSFPAIMIFILMIKMVIVMMTMPQCMV